MKLLLDEMWSDDVAAQLRRRGHDVVGVVETVGLPGADDPEILRYASTQGRAIVTENIWDFQRLSRELLSRGRSHPGLVLTASRVFPRANPRTVGRFVRALDALLRSGVDLSSTEHWLRPPG